MSSPVAPVSVTIDNRPSLTAAEIAARDRVTVETVRDRVKRGEYPGARKEGRSLRFPPDCRWMQPEGVDEATAAAAATAARAELRAWRAA